MIYLDTAYLARCYFEDPGYEQVRRLAEEQVVACCELGRVELFAVFHRKLREGTVTRSTLDEIVAQFDEDELIGMWNWLPLHQGLLEQASDGFRRLSKQIYLRSADAIHLTCAREGGFDAVYSNDRHLLGAAASFQLEGIDVITVP